MSVSFIINFKPKSDKLSDFHKIMSSVKSELPKVMGCISVLIHNSTEDSASYTVVETWQSKELHEKHVQSLVNTGAWGNIASHLVADPVGGYYQLM